MNFAIKTDGAVYKIKDKKRRKEVGLLKNLFQSTKEQDTNYICQLWFNMQKSLLGLIGFFLQKLFHIED